MLRIKILNQKNHPFTHKIKLYGMSIEFILIAFFVLIVAFVTAVYVNQHFKKKITNHHGTTIR